MGRFAPAVLAVGFSCGCWPWETINHGQLLAQERARDLSHLPEHGPARYEPKLPFTVVDGLNADEAVAIALLYNPDLRTFRRAVNVADAQIVAASALADVTLRLEQYHLQSATELIGYGITVRWAPPQPLALWCKRRSAKAGAEEARQEVFEREWEVASAVRAAVADLLALDGEFCRIAHQRGER